MSGRGALVEWGRWLQANVAGQTRLAALYRRAGINSPRRVAGRPSAAAFTARGRRCVRRRRCAEDETMRTTTAHSRQQVGATRPAGTRGNFPRLFACVSFVRSPRACPGRPGMAWARRMDEGPDPGENEDPGARLGRFTPSG
jgi:hypothetical protein